MSTNTVFHKNGVKGAAVMHSETNDFDNKKFTSSGRSAE